MKLMLIVAFAFIVGASAQCNVLDCINRYSDAIAAAGSDTTAILQATSNFCSDDCVSACSDDPSFSAVRNACDQLPPAECLTCLGEYTDAIADASDADAIADATRQFCQNSCVSDCRDEPTFAGVKAACYQLAPAACVTCLDEYTDAIAGAGDADAIVDATRQFCQNSCVSDCSDEPTFAGVKAACDQLPPAACVTCLGEYTDAIAGAGDADAIVNATRQFCQNSCVSDCDDEPTFAGAKAACDALPGGATPVYTVVTILSAMFFAGMAMIFN